MEAVRSKSGKGRTGCVATLRMLPEGSDTDLPDEARDSNLLHKSRISVAVSSSQLVPIQKETELIGRNEDVTEL